MSSEHQSEVEARTAPEQAPDPACNPSHEISARTSPHWSEVPPMRHQDAYVWFLLFSTIDVILTWHILERRGGSEINPIAAMIISHWGFIGAVVLKFALVLVVVLACELIARRRERVSVRLSWFAVAVSLVPPVWSFALLFLHAMKARGRF